MSNVTAVPIAPVKRDYVAWLILGILAALVAAAALARAGDTGITATPSGLRYKQLAPGTGVSVGTGPSTGKPTDNDIVLVEYEGRLADGTVFDKSQQPTPFPVTGVVPGFSEGLKLMEKGSRYRFWIPPQLGYGAEAKGPIPANSTLTFDVKLIDFISQQQLQLLQQQQQMMGAPGGPGGALPPGAVPPAGALPPGGR